MCLGTQNGTIEINIIAETDTFIPITDQGSYAWSMFIIFPFIRTKNIIFNKLGTDHPISEIFKNPVEANHLALLL